MHRLYDIFRAGKIGIATDQWTALTGKSWGAKTKELTGTPPLRFTTNGTPLPKWGIYGNFNNSSWCGQETANLLPFTDKLFSVTAGNSNLTAECKNGNLFFQGNAGEIGSNQAEWKNNFAFELEAGTYYCNSPAPLGQGFGRYIKKYDDNTTILTSTNYTFTLTEKTKCFLSFYIYQKTLDSQVGVMLNSGSSAVSYEPYGYKMPIICGNTTKTVYIGSNPLRKSLDGTAVDEISSDGTLTRRVDSDGSVLPTPVVSQIDTPTIPTVYGSNTLSVDTTVQPSQVYIKYYK